MSLTFHLLNMQDPKIVMNSSKIVYDFLKHIERSNQTNEGVFKRVIQNINIDPEELKKKTPQ